MVATNGTARRALVENVLPKLPPNMALTAVVDKRPVRPNWQHEAPLDRHMLTDLLLHGEDLPNTCGGTYHCVYTGIGLRLGEISGGLVALDHDGSSASQVIEQLSGKNVVEALPPTIGVTSGKHGRYQLIYRIPSRYWSAIAPKKILTGKEGEQLEFRWNGQQSVLAGKHPETGAYFFLPNSAPWETEIAQCPQWVIEQMLVDVPPEKLPKWREFERNFSLPIAETVPLTVCLSRNSRGILDGKFFKGRNDSGTALSRDLLGAANYLDSIGQRYDGDPEIIFMNWCREVGLDQDKPSRQPNSIWRSTEKSSPTPTLTYDQIEGCIKGWLWRQLRDKLTQSRAPDTVLTQKQLASSNRRAKLAAYYEEIKAAVGSQLRLNLLSQSIELNGERMSVDEVQIALALDHNMDVPDNVANKVIPKLAKQNPYNPFLEYLQSIHGKYSNRGADLLNSIAATYMGTSEHLYQVYVRRTLIAAVARAMKPGCKLDTALILNGEQGLKKSSFFEKLLPNPDWFCDSMGDISSKDELLKVHRACILEWAELETIFNRRGHSQIKSFLATKTDRIRVPYGRNLEDYPRHSIIVGTTNQPEFLTDPTGDRRYWVVPVKQRIDLKRLEAERDLLWAAAVDAYLQGEQWWLTDAEQQESSLDNENYRTEHPWTTAVASFVEFKAEVTASEVLMQIKSDIGTQSKGDQMAVADILTSLGWRKTRITRFGKQVKGWKKLEPPSTTYDYPNTVGGTTLKPSDINVFNDVVPPSTTFLLNETFLKADTNDDQEVGNSKIDYQKQKEIVINRHQVVLGGLNTQNTDEQVVSELVPPQDEVVKVVLGGTRFEVGNRVWWDECPKHCAWANPFTITWIENEMARLDLYAELVPISQLRHDCCE